MSTALALPDAVPASVSERLAAMVDEVTRLHSIKDFRDFEDEFLRNHGRAPATYRSYATAAAEFFAFLGDRKSFLEWTAADVERWLESIPNINTRATRAAGLSAVCRTVVERVPAWASPFDALTDETRQQLLKKPVDDGPKLSLSAPELKRLLAELDETTLWNISTRALVRFLTSTGLRSAEAVSLKWGDLSQPDDDGRWFAAGVGKGDRPFNQPVLDPEAIPELRRVFRKLHGRTPRADDALLWSLPERGGSARPLSYSSLRKRLARLGETQSATSRSLEWTAHLLRRTAGSLLADAAMPIHAVQAFLRHRSVQTTMKAYVRTTLVGFEFFEKALA